MRDERRKEVRNKQGHTNNKAKQHAQHAQVYMHMCMFVCSVLLTTCTHTCVQVEFFGDDAPVKEGKDGVMIVRYTDGRASGDAIVLFENRDLENAMAKNRQCMGSRYVELYRSTMQEFQMV